MHHFHPTFRRLPRQDTQARLRSSAKAATTRPSAPITMPARPFVRALDTLRQVRDCSALGRNLADHLGDVYGRRSRLVVLFISKHYPAKAWPTHERQSAQARAILENEVVLLPARFDDTEVARNERIIGRSGVARRVDVTVWQSVGT